jgi:hypothetical protein
LKPEWWGSQLVQEKYQEEEACDKRIITTIIIPTKTAILCTAHILRKVLM